MPLRGIGDLASAIKSLTEPTENTEKKDISH